MHGFKQYLEGKEEEEDIQNTLAGFPEHIRKLAQGFTMSFQGGNTLNNDGQHVGVVQSHPRPHITIAAPWNYSRSMVFAHEIGHMVWAHLMDHQKRKEWSELLRHTPMEPGSRQNDEESFSMIFAATYVKHPPTTYYKPNLIKFIKSI